MDQEAFGALWGLLSRAWPNSELFTKPETAAMYFDRLSDLEPEWALAGAMRCIDEMVFPPTIADLRVAADTEQFSRRRTALPEPARPLDELIPPPWFVRLQFARQRDGRKPGFVLTEDREAVERECAERGIVITDWPQVPDWYGQDQPPFGDGHELLHNEGCTGNVLHEFEGEAVMPVYAPCPACAPGRRSLWECGELRGGWVRNEKAVRRFVRAEIAADRTPVPPAGEERSYVEMWRRIIRGRGEEEMTDAVAGA